ncbi:MAG: zeta toxin family protein [Rickettsiales bacterium]|nr:zeta toxin family protein [Rickettsiales bacterium]
MNKALKYERSNKLRMALAINRGIEFLRSFKSKSNVTQTQWGSYLDDLFRQVYLELFIDTTPISPQQKLQGLLETSQRAMELSVIFHDFARKFYDHNGFFSTTDRKRNAELMAELYVTLERFYPFADATSLVLRVFFTALGRMRGFQEKLGGIDFRRLSTRQAIIVADEHKTPEQMREVLLTTMEKGRIQEYRENTPPHFYWEDRSVTLYGKRFIQADRNEVGIELTTPVPDDEALIVLVNGALITHNQCVAHVREHMESGELLGTLRIPPEHWVGRLTDLGADIFGRPIFDKTDVDCIDVTEGSLPICMNLHPLTLLSHSQHSRLEHYLASEFNSTILELRSSSFAEEVTVSLRGFERGEKIVALAAQQIQLVVESLRAGIEHEISKYPNAKAVETPHLVMTMGGSGSGKGSNHYFNEHYKDENGKIRDDYIYASLDEGRPYSDIYHVLIAAGHHADDYEAVHLWADTRRNWLCEMARDGNYNVVFDGSGVDYKGRYDKIVEAFSNAGYRTEVVAADCLLLTPDSRRDKYPVPALDRIMYRAGYNPDGAPLPPKEDGHYRTLPWRIAINKHIGFPASLLAAWTDKHLGKVILVDNAGVEGEDRVIAESFILDDRELFALEAAEQSDGLVPYLMREKLMPYGVLSQEVAAENTGYLAARVGGVNHVFVMVDTERMVDVMEKAQMNLNAHGPSNLTLVKFLASFVIDRIDKPDAEDMTPPEMMEAYREVLAKNPDTPRPNYLGLNAGS